MAENFNVDLSDLLIDEDFYCSNFKGSEEHKCFDDPQSFYKENGLKDCDPVNQYFLKHPELLYDNKICKFQNAALSNDDIDFINKIINEEIDVKKLVKKNISELIKSQPKEVDSILLHENTSLKSVITDEYIENTWYKISKIVLDFYEKELNNDYQANRWLASKILINYSAFHSPDDKQFNLVLELAKKDKNLNQKITQELVSKFSDRIQKIEYSDFVFENFLHLIKAVNDNQYRCNKECNKNLIEIVKTGVNNNKIIIDDENAFILEDLYKAGKHISYEALIRYVETFKKDATNYTNVMGEIIDFNNDLRVEVIRDISNSSIKLLDDILKEERVLDSVNKEKKLKDLIFIIYRINLQYEDFLKNNVPEIQKKLAKLEELKYEKLTRVVHQLKNNLNGIIKDNSQSFEKISNGNVNKEFNEYFEKIKSSKKEEAKKFCKQIKFLAEDLGWDTKNLGKILSKFPTAQNQEKIFINELTDIFQIAYEYKIPDNWIDREGNTIFDILNDYESEQWAGKIWSLYKDNTKYFIKSSSRIIQEFSDIQLNEGYNDASYLKSKLKAIELFEKKLSPNIALGYDKITKNNSKKFDKWSVSANNKSEIILSGQDYQNQPFEYEISQFLPIEIKENLLNVLLKNQPYHPDYIKEVEKVYYKIYLPNWALQIKEVNAANLSEVIAILKHAIYLTVLEGKYKVRDAQVISLLNLYKSGGNRLIQVSTGEGKSIIIAMLAALNVINGKNVDIATSSSALATKEPEELGGFYALLGISVTHNIQDYNTEAKECYKSNVVYGDILTFIGDDLRDITQNTKYGRGYGVLIVDEVDNLFIDQTNMKVQLSSGLPGFEHLKKIITPAWGQYHIIGNFVLYDEKDEKYFELIKQEDEDNDEEYSLIGSHREYQEYLRKNTAKYAKDGLLDLENDREFRKIVIPKHLEDFVLKHSDNWIRSIERSLYYQENLEYIISNKSGKKDISPVDYKNTGVLQHSLTWSDGLHQFLQLKHGLSVKQENLTSIFKSYPGYFLKYKGNIYGLTGTLGEKEHHEFLTKVYGIDSVIIPNYIHKKLAIFPEVITKSYKEWFDTISEQVFSTAKGHDRAVLVIMQTIQDVNNLYKHLLIKGYDKEKIYKYINDQDQTVLKKRLEIGEVVIATNLAGRGADFKIDREVNYNGGLHVILSFLSESIRVQNQAEGRAARNGDYGSAQLIINASQIHDINLLNDKGESRLQEYRENRYEREKESLSNFIDIEFPKIELRDRLFENLVGLIRTVNSPTGYEIVRNNQYIVDHNKIYIFNSQGEITIKCLKQESKVYNFAEVMDISSYIENINYEGYLHLTDVLEDGKRILNSLDYELIQFFGSELGCIKEEYKEIKSYVDTKYSKIASDVEDRVKQKFNYDKDNPDEEYQKKILEEVNKEEYKEKFNFWETHRKYYNNESETKQIEENWAVWLSQSQALEEFESYDKEKDDVNENAKLKKAVIDSFEEFNNKQLELFKNQKKRVDSTELLLKNPAYLVQKSRNYMKTHFYEKSEGKKARRVGGGLIVGKDFRRFFEQAGPIGEAVEFSEEAIDMDRHFAWTGYNMLSLVRLIKDQDGITDYDQAEYANEVKQEFVYDLSDTINSIHQYMIPAQQSQCAYILISGIVEKTSDTMKQCLLVAKAYEKIADHLKDLIDQVVDTEGDEMIMVSAIKGPDSILQDMSGADLVSAYDAMVGIKKENLCSINEDDKGGKEQIGGVTEGSILSDIGGALSGASVVLGPDTKTENKTKKPCTVNEDDKDNEVKKCASSDGKEYEVDEKGDCQEGDEIIAAKDDQKYLTRLILNKAFGDLENDDLKPYIHELSRELYNSGFLAYEITTYGLEKDWTDTFIAAIIAIATLAFGFHLMLANTGLMAIFGLSMGIQGLSEIIQIIVAIDNGMPIDLGDFVMGHAIGVGISLVMVGIANFGGNQGWWQIANLPGAAGVTTALEGMVAVVKGVAISEAIGRVTKEISKEYINSNDGDIKQDVEDGSTKIIDKNRDNLIKILAEDIWKSSTRNQDEILRKSAEAARGHAEVKTLKSVAQQIGSKTISMIPTFGGKVVGGIFLGMANAAAGHAKGERAMKKIASRLADYFEYKANSVMSTKDMMYAGLKYSYGEVEASNILKIAANASGIILGRELNWQECNKFKNINIEEAKKDGVVSICNRVKSVMEKASSSEQMASIREGIAKVVFPIIKKIYENEVVKPIVNTGADMISTTIDEIKLAKQEKEAIDTVSKIKGLTKDQVKNDYKGKNGKVNREKLFQDLNELRKGTNLNTMAEERGLTKEEIKLAYKGKDGKVDYTKLFQDIDKAGQAGIRVATAYKGGGVVEGERGDSYECSGGMCKAENKVGEGRKVEPGMVWDALNQGEKGNVKRVEVEKHKIKRGDTVSGVMDKYKLSEEEIRNLNPQLVDLNRIIAGETLNVPKGSHEKVVANYNKGSKAFKAGGETQIGGSCKAPAGGILDGRNKIKITGFTEKGELVYENEIKGTCNVIGGKFKTSKELVEEAVKEGGYQKFKQEVIKRGEVKEYIFNQEYQYGGSPLGMGGLRRTDYKVIEDIYLDKYLRDVFNEYLKNKKVTIDEKKLKYRNNEVEVAKGILVNRYVALEMHHEYMGGELLKEMRDGKGPTEVLLGAIMVKMVNYLKTKKLKLEGILQDKFPGGYIDANEILAGATDVAGTVDAKYEETPILGHAWQAGKGSALYVYDKSPVWLKAAVDMAILPESLLMTGKLIKNIRKGGSGIEILKEKYARYKTIKWIEAQYAKMDAAAEKGNLTIEGNRVGKNVGDKVELYDFEKGEIAKKGIGVGSDGEVYISKEALEYFKKGEKGGESGLKKGEKGANDNIIKPYTGPSTGYKSKVGGEFSKEVVDKIFDIPKQNLNKFELENLKRFEKKLPSSDNTKVSVLKSGNKLFSAEVQGNVPGSKAVYNKIINEKGNTIDYYKVTYAPDGSIIHIKNKFNKKR